MLSDYIDKLQARGKLSFTHEEAMKDLNASYYSIASAIYRLKKKGCVISPARGFYIIIPPKDRQIGSIPPEDILPLLAKHEGFHYYAGLLTAGAFYGAAHQRPTVFQIFVDKKLKKDLKFGRVRIEYFFKEALEQLPTKDFLVRTGYLKVSTPEVTAMDLLQKPHKSGGLSNVATVLAELIESIDAAKLILLAKRVGNNTWLQRFGYILEMLEPDDYAAKERILPIVRSYLQLEPLTYIPLAPDMPTAGFSRSETWKIIENTIIESDI